MIHRFNEIINYAIDAGKFVFDFCVTRCKHLRL